MEISNLILQESYFGKDSILLECEECIKAMKEAMVSGKNPNSIPEKTTFESLITKKFNCEKVYLSILADESGLNAYTVPYFYEKNYNYSDDFFDLKNDNTGIQYKNSLGKILYIYINSYMLRNASIESIMGSVLHEIGHNFFFIKEQIQNRRAKSFTDLVIEVMKIIKEYEGTQYSNEINAELIRILINNALVYKKGTQISSYESVKKLLTDKAFSIANEKSKADLKGLQKAFYSLKISLKSFKIAFKFIKNSLMFMILSPTIINIIKTDKALKREFEKSKGYAAEKFSDNFAISYGYGKATAMDFINLTSEVTYSSKIISKIPIVRIMDYYNRTYFCLVKYVADEHPSDQKRVIFTLEKLKYELTNNKKNMSPKQILEIEKDIIEIENAIKNVPRFKKSVDNLFLKLDNERDKMAMIDMTDEEIYDFDKKILNNKIKNEDFDISYYLSEDYEKIINEYFESPIMDILNE